MTHKRINLIAWLLFIAILIPMAWEYVAWLSREIDTIQWKDNQ